MSLRHCTDQLIGLTAVGGWATAAFAGGTVAAMAEPVTSGVILATALAAKLRSSDKESCADALDKARKTVERNTRRVIKDAGHSPEHGKAIDQVFKDLKVHLPAIRPSIDDLVKEWRLDPKTVASELITRFLPLSSTAQNNHVARQIVEQVIIDAVAAVKDDPDVFSKLGPAINRTMLADLGWLKETVERIDETTKRTDENVQKLVDQSQKTAIQLGLQTGLLVAMARRYADEAADDFDSAHRAIEEALRLAADERARAALPSNVDDAVDAVLKTMAALNDAGDMDAAQAALDDELRAMEAEEERRKVGFARLYQRGITQARLMNNAEQAAEFAVKEAELERALDFDGLRQLQNHWYERGRDKGVNFDLRVAIGLAGDMLQRAVGSDARGKALNDLGIALSTLGERESATERLEQAVVAYEDALKEWTREADPHNWAIIKNNLGNALKTLGERESGTGRLEQAVSAYEDALKERTRAAVPLHWATIKNNLGSALQTLGERESGTERLEQAVAAYEDALKERTRKAVPLGWAMTKTNLGNALAALGERESGTERLEQAVAAYEDALKEWTRARVPLNWAGTKNNLGSALQTLGERESGTERLEQAVVAYEDALKERTRERVPLDWAGTNCGLGTALAILGERRGERDLVVRGLGLIDDAIPVLEEGGHEVWAAEAKSDREKARAILARMGG